MEACSSSPSGDTSDESSDDISDVFSGDISDDILNKLSLSEFVNFLLSTVQSNPELDINIYEKVFLKKLHTAVRDVRRYTAYHGAHQLASHGAHQLAFYGAHHLAFHGASQLASHAAHKLAFHGAHQLAFRGASQLTFHGARQLNYISLMKLFASYGSDVNEPRRDDETPLHILLKNPEINKCIVDYLILNGADVRIKSRFLERALFTAIRKLDVSTVRNILQQPNALDSCNNRDETPLMVAARVGSLEIVEMLLANGANPNIIVKDMMAVHYAALTGNRMIFKCLLERSNYKCITECKPSSIHYNIIKSHYLDCLEVLLESDYCQEILKEKVYDYQSITLTCSKRNQICIVGCLSLYHLHYSAEDNEKFLDAIVERGFPVNSTSETCIAPLSLATVTFGKQTGDYLKRLIAHGANVNYPDPAAPEALLCLLKLENASIVLYFLQHTDFATPDSLMSGYLQKKNMSEIAPDIIELFLTLGMTQSSVRLIRSYGPRKEIPDFYLLTENVCSLQQLCRLTLRNLFYSKCKHLSMAEILNHILLPEKIFRDYVRPATRLPTLICNYLRYEIL